MGPGVGLRPVGELSDPSRKRSVHRSSGDDVDLLIPICTCDAPEVLGKLWRLFLLRSTSPWRDGGQTAATNLVPGIHVVINVGENSRAGMSPVMTAHRSEKTWTPPGYVALQAPIKERYKADPKAGLITLKAKGTLDDANIACKVETGRALAVAGLHPATGGSGLELCSGDMLLEALVACAGVTLKAVATAIDIPLKSGTVSAEGDLDFRGTLGVAKDALVGFAQINLRFEVDSDVPQEKLDQLLKLTERYCVVYQTIRSGPPVEVSLKRK